MLSILLTVALFKSTSAVTCEGDQVQTCSCYYRHLKISWKPILLVGSTMPLCLLHNLGLNCQRLEQYLKHNQKSNQVLEEGLGGTITSVNFPNNYEDNTDCSFTILPVPGNHVTLQVNLILHHQDIYLTITTCAPTLAFWSFMRTLQHCT